LTSQHIPGSRLSSNQEATLADTLHLFFGEAMANICRHKISLSSLIPAPEQGNGDSELSKKRCGGKYPNWGA
jgi:hypothetical protein